MLNLNLTKNQFRLFSLLPVLACAGLLAYALYVEYVDFLSPCPLCILQRVVFFVIGFLFVIAAIKPVMHWGRKLTGITISLVSLVGMAISARHVWLQGLPADKVPDCGPGLAYMLEISPFFDTIASVLQGSGSCAEISWTFLGMSMPAWTLLCYLGLLVFTIVWMRVEVKNYANL